MNYTISLVAIEDDWKVFIKAFLPQKKYFFSDTLFFYFTGPLTNSTAPAIIIDTFFMYENGSFDFKVIVRKDDRMLVIEQNVVLVIGDPPEMYLM